MQAWCDSKGFDTVMHPIPKCVIFSEDLLQEMVDRKFKDPFINIILHMILLWNSQSGQKSTFQGEV